MGILSPEMWEEEQHNLKSSETTLGEYNSGTSLSRKSKKKPHTDAAGKTLKIHIQSFQNSVWLQATMKNKNSKVPQLAVR